MALNINQFARISSSPGSLYSYISSHLNPVWGVMAGWALLIAYVGTAIAIAAGLTNYLNVLLKSLFGIQALPALLAALAIGLAAWLAYRDITISTRLMLALEVISVTLISIVAIGVLVRYGFRPDMAQFGLQGVTADKLRMGLVLALFCSVGFESATSLGTEAKDPLRTIPRAVKWSGILAGIFFLFCAYTEVLGFRGEAVPLDKSLAPLHVLARNAGLPDVLGLMIDLGALVSFFSCLLACITAGARVLFLMAQKGALHSPPRSSSLVQSDAPSRRPCQFASGPIADRRSLLQRHVAHGYLRSRRNAGHLRLPDCLHPRVGHRPHFSSRSRPPDFPRYLDLRTGPLLRWL